MSDLVERVARVLCETEFGPGMWDIQLPRLDHEFRDKWRQLARAAIAVLKSDLELNKTAREVICAALPRSQDDFIADDILHELAAAGFVILPKEPTDQLHHMLFGLGMSPESYRKLIAAASQNP